MFKLFLAPSNDLISAQGSSFGKLLDFERYKTILKTAMSMLWNLAGTPISLVGLIILMAVFVGRSADQIPGMWTIAVVIGLQLVIYFDICLLTPLRLTYHLSTSLDRLY